MGDVEDGFRGSTDGTFVKVDLQTFCSTIGS